MGVLSNKRDALTKALVALRFPTIPFLEVRGEREGVPRKPDPTAAFEMALALNVLPANIGFVGDTAVDMKVARAAGMRAIGLPLADGDEGNGSTGQARQRGFLYALIPLGIGTLGCVSMLTGSALENGRFGSGQAFIAAGLIAAAFSAIAHQVLEIVGATRGYGDSWLPTPPPGLP